MHLGIVTVSQASIIFEHLRTATAPPVMAPDTPITNNSVPERHTPPAALFRSPTRSRLQCLQMQSRFQSLLKFSFFLYSCLSVSRLSLSLSLSFSWSETSTICRFHTDILSRYIQLNIHTYIYTSLCTCLTSSTFRLSWRRQCAIRVPQDLGEPSHLRNKDCIVTTTYAKRTRITRSHRHGIGVHAQSAMDTVAHGLEAMFLWHFLVFDETAQTEAPSTLYLVDGWSKAHSKTI